MSSWTNHKVEIYGYGSSITIGPLWGTITRIIDGGAEGTNNLDEEGRGSFKIHGSDTPSLSLCQEYRLARVTADSSVSGLTHEIACFIIREIKPEVVGRHVIVTVSGPDFIGNIKWGNIGFNVISDNAGGPSTTPVVDALAYSDKGWSVTNHGIAPNGAVIVGSGETAYVALTTLLQQMNAHMSFALVNNPSFTLHVWYEFTDDSGITLLETNDPASYQASTTTAIIKDPIRITKEPQEVYSRAYIFGAGMGADRRTIAEAQGLVTLDAQWEVNYSESWIRNRQLEEDGHPIIWTTKGFPSYEPSDPDDETAVETNAIALIYAGITWLSHRSQSIITYYEIPDLIIHNDIIPGQLVHVTYNRSSPVNSGGSMVTTEILDLDDDLIVLGIRHRIGPGGIRYTSLLVGDTPKRISTGVNIMTEKIKDLEEAVRHTNAGSGGGGTAPSGESSYLWATGSGPVLSGNLLVEPLVTIDGVDISAHAADPDAHHVPGTLSVNTINVNNGTETHEVDASSDPGPQAYLLQTDAGGRLVLVRIDLDSLVLTDRTTLEPYNIFIDNGKMFIEPI